MSDILAEAYPTAMVPTKTLVPYDKNPRIHTDDAVDKMIESITAFGFRIPILIKYHTHIKPNYIEVIDGHLRLKAAEKMGLANVPVMDASDMTEAQVKAFRIMVNRSVSWADWDEQLLLDEMKLIGESELMDAHTLAALTGFDQAELEQVLALDQEPINPEDEWSGMPAYHSEDKTAFRSLAMHFPDQASVDEFAGLIGQKITEATRMCWYPPVVVESYSDKQWAGGGGEASEVSDVANGEPIEPSVDIGEPDDQGGEDDTHQASYSTVEHGAGAIEADDPPIATKATEEASSEIEATPPSEAVS